MSPEEPFPPALPAVFQSPIGPAISYSNIRAVTSRAERTLDQLDSKIKKRLAGQINDSGMAGAVVESKVRQRLANQIAPAEQLFNDTTDLIQNQLAGNLAPAVATLEDLQGGTVTSQSSPSKTETAVVRTPERVVTSAQAETPLTQQTPLRAGVLARQLSRAPGLVAGGPPISKQPCTLSSIPTQTLADLSSIILTNVAAAFNGNIPFDPNHAFNITDNCLLYVQQITPPIPLFPCGQQILEGMVNDAANKIAADVIVAAFKSKGYTLTYVQPDVACPPSPVDCTIHPLDPSCPPDCKTHPEDPRCPPTPPTCPPPCIEVTCPPPIINVPPCQTLTPTECIQIDLCDWDKFCSFIKKCFVESKKECALDNDTAYALADCDGLLIKAQTDYFGPAADTLNNAGTVNDAIMPSSVLTAQLVNVSLCGRDILADCVPA